MDRSGDEQVAKSALHPWAEAQTRPLRGGGEINISTPAALKLFLPPKNAQSDNPNTYRNAPVVYPHTRQTKGNIYQQKNYSENHNNTAFDLPLPITVARSKPGVA